jgi:hypothetical protein
MSEVNGRVIFGGPKTHADRWIAIPSFLRAEISALMAGKGPDDLLFTSPRGEVLRVHGFRRRRFDRAAVTIGIPGSSPTSCGTPPPAWPSPPEPTSRPSSRCSATPVRP